MILCLPKLLGDLGGQLLVAVFLSGWTETTTVPSPVKCLEIYACQHDGNTERYSCYCCLEEWLALGKNARFSGKALPNLPHTPTPPHQHRCICVRWRLSLLCSSCLSRLWKSQRKEDSLSLSWGQLCCLTISPPSDSSLSIRDQDINSQ